MPAHFYLLSLHQRTLSDVLRRQHPLQMPLPFNFVVAIVSGIADALEAAASKGVVHLNMSADNVMVDEPEMVAYQSVRRRAAAAGAVAVAAGGDGGIAEDIDVEYSACIRRFEEPPVAVVTNWGASMVFDHAAAAEWVVRVPTERGRLVLAGQPWGSEKHACPELHTSLARASELTPFNAVVHAARQAMVSAVKAGEHALVCRVAWCCTDSQRHFHSGAQPGLGMFGVVVCGCVWLCVCVSATTGGITAPGCKITAGGDAADIEEKRARRFLVALAAAARCDAVRRAPSLPVLLDCSKQPSFEVGILGFYVATGVHPCGDGYPSGLPTPYDAASYPAMPPSWPPSFRELLVQCVSIDAIARPGIVEVASRLRELRSAAWLSVEEALSLRRRLVSWEVDLSASMCLVGSWFSAAALHCVQADRDGSLRTAEASSVQLRAQLVLSVMSGCNDVHAM